MRASREAALRDSHLEYNWEQDYVYNPDSVAKTPISIEETRKIIELHIREDRP
jgi:hypothetical protein